MACANPYIVLPGDSLSKIGNRCGVSWQQIAQLNGITSPYVIQPGQRLLLPGGSASSTGGAPGGLDVFRPVGGNSNTTNYPANYIFAGDRIEWNAWFYSSSLLNPSTYPVYEDDLARFKNLLNNANYQSIELTVTRATHLGYWNFYVVVRVNSPIDRNSIYDIQGDLTRFAREAGFTNIANTGDDSKNSIRLISAGARRTSISNNQGAPVSPGPINNQTNNNGSNNGSGNDFLSKLSTTLGWSVPVTTGVIILLGFFWLTRD